MKLLYLNCFNVNILDFVLFYSFTKCYHGNNWVKDTFLSYNLMFIIISNIFVMNKDYIIIWENNQKDNDIYIYTVLDTYNIYFLKDKIWIIYVYVIANNQS